MNVSYSSTQDFVAVGLWAGASLAVSVPAFYIITAVEGTPWILIIAPMCLLAFILMAAVFRSFVRHVFFNTELRYLSIFGYPEDSNELYYNLLVSSVHHKGRSGSKDKIWKFSKSYYEAEQLVAAESEYKTMLEAYISRHFETLSLVKEEDDSTAASRSISVPVEVAGLKEEYAKQSGARINTKGSMAGRYQLGKTISDYVRIYKKEAPLCPA